MWQSSHFLHLQSMVQLIQDQQITVIASYTRSGFHRNDFTNDNSIGDSFSYLKYVTATNSQS